MPTVPALDYAAENNFGGVALQEAGPGETVARITIDAIGLSSCHLIKIDVEGMETDVIAGAAETIRRCRPLLYVENDRAERSAALIQQIIDLDYRLSWHLPPLFNPDNYFGAHDNAFGDILSVNMLCVPQERATPADDLPEVRSAEDDWRPIVMARLRGEAGKTP
jgi:hypothetical protein